MQKTGEERTSNLGLAIQLDNLISELETTGHVANTHKIELYQRWPKNVVT